ncbi:phosphonate ABC transporter inner membrane subunit, partial [Ochrobactrum sp. CDB2]
MTVSSLDGNGAKSLPADYRREVGKRRLYGIALLLALVV